jgi:hypothetical protein
LISDKHENCYIVDVVAKLGSIKRRDIEELNENLRYSIQLPVLIGSGSHFQKGNGILNRGNTNSFAEVSVIPIATWDDNRAWILANDGDDECVELKKGTSYRVTMSLDGFLDIAGRFELQGCGIWIDLLWRDKKGIELKIHKRNPDYEY